MRVRLQNFAGLDEAGIDGGGIFREFMSELIKTAFDPNRGFFLSTADKLLYPNPQAHLLVDSFTSHFYFLGRILGKVCINVHTTFDLLFFFHVSMEKHVTCSLKKEIYRVKFTLALFICIFENLDMFLGIRYLLNDILSQCSCTILVCVNVGCWFL